MEWPKVEVDPVQNSQCLTVLPSALFTPKPQMLSSSLLNHWPEATVPDLFLFRCKSLCLQALLTSGSLLRRLGSNQYMQTSVSPSSAHAHLCFMPLLILYVLSAPHPTSEQGNSHSSRTYSNEASSKTLNATVVCALENSYLEG